MTSIVHRWVVDTKFLYYSRGMWLLAGIVICSTAAAIFASVTAAVARQQQFSSTLEQYAEHGESLADALQNPVRVVTKGNMQTIDNPLKYDYIQLGHSFDAIRGPLNISATSLDFVTFIILPVVFVFVGAFVATYDQRAGTMLFRCSQTAWRKVIIAKLTSIFVASILAVSIVVFTSLILAIPANMLQGHLLTDSRLVMPPSAQMSVFATKLIASVLIAFFFGFFGYALGSLTGSSSWSVVVVGIFFFVVPFFGAWDPRNALTVIATSIYDFWGAFELRPPDSLTHIQAAGILLFVVTACAIIISGFPRGQRKYSLR